MQVFIAVGQLVRQSVRVITGDAEKTNSTGELYLAEGVKRIHRRRFEA